MHGLCTSKMVILNVWIRKYNIYYTQQQNTKMQNKSDRRVLHTVCATDQQLYCLHSL